jgi:hypothetical protein
MRATTDRLTDTDVHAIVEHCTKHAEPLPREVLFQATSNQLHTVARMLDRGGFHADARDIRRFVRVSGSRF